MSAQKSVRRLLQEAPQEDLAIGFRDVERRIEHRRAQKAVVRRWQLGASGFALAALCVFAALPEPPAETLPPRTIVVVDKNRAALHVAAQGALSPADARAKQDTAREDTRALELHVGARVRQLGATADEHTIALDEGTIALHLQEQPAEPWTIHAGATRIDATGADFSMRREGASLHVHVFRGAVLVSGTRVPGQATWVKAGREVTFDDNEPAVAAVAVGPSVRGMTRNLRNEPREEAENVDHVGSLLLEADRARARGDLVAAKNALNAILERDEKDRRAGTAAFILGKLELETEANAPAAARSFERALALGLPSALIADARARLVEALALGGDSLGARRVQDVYNASLPERRGDPKVESWEAR